MDNEMIKKWSFFLNVLIFIGLALPSFAKEVQDLNSNTSIKIGSSTALEGDAESLGQQMTFGETLYFNKINAEGGINDKKIELIVYNDSYEPSLTAINMRRLINQDNVLAIIGNVGTPTSIIAVPIADELKVLLYGCYAGSDVLHKTLNPYVFNFRASYADETTSMINGLLQAGIKPSEIAFFTQNDSFGENGYSGAITALKAAGYNETEDIPHGYFSRNTLNVEEGLAEILEAPISPKAIIIVGAYRPAAQFIKLAIKDMPNTLFFNVSFVGGDVLAKELGSVGNNQVIVTQVVPDFNSSLPAVKEYRESLKKYGNNAAPNYISLEGYLATKLFVVALQGAAKANKLTRSGIIEAMENLHNVDIGIDIPISYDKKDHRGLSKVWPTLLHNGEFIPFNWNELGQLLRDQGKGY
jgi:branched-chain amino acid transport system substrate-binding protein